MFPSTSEDGNTQTPYDLTPEILLNRYENARRRRGSWESLWRDCYDYALPRRDGAVSPQSGGEVKRQRLFDGTAPDAVEQLAASLMAELTPAWSRWLDFVPGPEVEESEEEGEVARELQKLAHTLHGHFDRSNFQVEIHQCFLDLIVTGTACLLFEEAPIGDSSAFKFTAVPLSEVVVEEGPSGRLDTTFRHAEMSEAQLRQRFPNAPLSQTLFQDISQREEVRFKVLEGVVPDALNRYRYLAILQDGPGAEGGPVVLAEGQFGQSPFLTFRWSKAPGEIYGRSPVMKVLPDIKTANKVVELMLQNASIAVAGIWQADDDGVLNPATIKLAPGTIIPKAVGSQGLQPLQPASDFNLSEALLHSLRDRIRHGLMADQLSLTHTPQMTATEILERSSLMARMLGASYGRLQTELLMPLVRRALILLHRRGEASESVLDSRLVMPEIIAPLARRQRLEKAAPLLQWFSMVGAAGPEALAVLDMTAAARWLAESLSVPQHLLRSPNFMAMPPMGPAPTVGPESPPLDGVLSETLSSPQA